MKKKIDRRTKYTLDVIKDTVLKLSEKKEINKITVTEICKIADINRATFYKYYRDIYDLIEQLEKELYKSIKKAIEIIEKTQDLKPFIENMINAIYENKDTCKILFGKNGNKDLLRKIIYLTYLDNIIDFKRKLKNYSSKEIDYIFEFIAYGSMGIIENWALEDFNENKDNITNLIVNLTTNILED